MHDRYYATPPADWVEYRWRLQLLAEERVGVAVRRSAQQEDAAWNAVSDALGG